MKVGLEMELSLLRQGLPDYLSKTLVILGHAQMSAVPSKDVYQASVTDMMGVIFD